MEISLLTCPGPSWPASLGSVYSCGCQLFWSSFPRCISWLYFSLILPWVTIDSPTRWYYLGGPTPWITSVLSPYPSACLWWQTCLCSKHEGHFCWVCHCLTLSWQVEKCPFVLVRNRAPLRSASVKGVYYEDVGVSHGIDEEEEQGACGRGCGSGVSLATRSVCLSCWKASCPSSSWGQWPILVSSVDRTCLLFDVAIEWALRGPSYTFWHLIKFFSDFLFFFFWRRNMTGSFRSSGRPCSCQLWPDRWGHWVSTFFKQGSENTSSKDAVWADFSSEI